jgi:fibronectin type 3 domain-containing protein
MVPRKVSLLLLVILIPGCGYVGGSNVSEFEATNSYSNPPTFAEIQANILQPKCVTCHSSGSFIFTSYASLTASGVVVASQPLSSPLYLQVAAGLMPQNGPPLSSTDTQAIYNWIAAGALSGAASAPNAPTNLVATAASATEIDLTWVDNASDETSYGVERATALGGPYTLIATPAANSTSYADTTALADSTYYYRVYAANAGGNSAFSNSANATTANAAPIAPSALAANAISSSEIDLSWVDNSNNETGFEIQRGTSSAGPFTTISTAAANATAYSDTGLSTSTTYYYRIDATNGIGSSAFTAVVNATTSAPSVPNAPSNLIATAASATEIDLTWTDNSSNETGFVIQRSTSSSGPFAQVGTVGANLTSYQDTGVSAATTYYYKVAAQNAGGDSGFTVVASAFSFGTYTWLATNIFSPKCISCHSGGGAPLGYQLTSYAGTMSQVVAGNATGSNLYQEVLSGAMPQGGTALTADQLSAVRTWINSGAANN